MSAELPAELRAAFKEWAAVCRALAEGRQTVILRKGGIHEEEGEFVPEHRHFWLYPTYLHQQREGLKPEALPLLEAAEAGRPPAGTLHFDLVAAVTAVRFADDLEVLHGIRDRHLWSDATVEQRFHYRRPGLYVLELQIHRLGEPHAAPDRPEYEGCKTWVELQPALPTAGAMPVRRDGGE